ncbi:hypothetical protein BD769DRAFT_1664455 [Suillus cothurnatus]|nr:hypothetical protein BD769DRAFT_1664455 [Suillus cothurnatus]
MSLVSHHYKIIAADSGQCLMLPSATGIVTAKRYAGATNEQWNIQVQGTADTGPYTIENLGYNDRPLATYSAPCNEGDYVVGKQADTQWKIVDNGNGTKSIYTLNYAWTVDGSKVTLYLRDSADSRQRFTFEQI